MCAMCMGVRAILWLFFLAGLAAPALNFLRFLTRLILLLFILSFVLARFLGLVLLRFILSSSAFTFATAACLVARDL